MRDRRDLSGFLDKPWSKSRNSARLIGRQAVGPDSDGSSNQLKTPDL